MENGKARRHVQKRWKALEYLKAGTQMVWYLEETAAVVFSRIKMPQTGQVVAVPKGSRSPHGRSAGVQGRVA